MSEPVLEAIDLERRFQDGNHEIRVLCGVTLTVQEGALVAVVGSSGSGKSTLLHLLGGLDGASGGRVLVGGRDWATLGDRARGRLRNRALGFVYQFHHLMPEFNAVENVAMPLLIRREGLHQATKRAREALEWVDLEGRFHHRPSELSGGERQRTAVARAIVTRPRLLLADEPTGNLDPVTGERIHELLLALNRDLGTALVVVTHDLELASHMAQRYRLIEGQLRPD